MTASTDLRSRYVSWPGVKTDADTILDAVLNNTDASEPICTVGAILGQFVVTAHADLLTFDVEIRDANSLATYAYAGLDANGVMDVYDSAVQILRSRTLVYRV